MNVQKLNFEKINSRFLCFNYKLDYQFSDLSFKSFEKYLSSLLPFLSQKYNINTTTANDNDSNFNVAALTMPLLHSDEHDIFEITLGDNATHQLTLDSFSRLYQSAGDKCLFNINNVSFRKILSNSHIGEKTTIRDIEYILYNLLNNGELSLANSILMFVDVFANRKDLFCQEIINQTKCDILENINNNVLVLKKYWQYHIYFGTSCKESKILYKTIYKLIKKEFSINYTDDNINTGNTMRGEYFYFSLLILWYTQRADFMTHRCFECNKSILDKIREFAINDTTLKTFGSSNLNPIDVFVNDIKAMQHRCVPKDIEFVLNPDDQDRDSISIEWRIATTLRYFDVAIEQFYLKAVKSKDNYNYNDNYNDLEKKLIVQCNSSESWTKKILTVPNIENLIDSIGNKNIISTNQTQRQR